MGPAPREVTPAALWAMGQHRVLQHPRNPALKKKWVSHFTLRFPGADGDLHSRTRLRALFNQLGRGLIKHAFSSFSLYGSVSGVWRWPILENWFPNHSQSVECAEDEFNTPCACRGGWCWQWQATDLQVNGQSNVWYWSVLPRTSGPRRQSNFITGVPYRQHPPPPLLHHTHIPGHTQ